MSKTKEFYFNQINQIDDMIDDDYFYQRWLNEQYKPVCSCDASRLGSVDAHGKIWCVCGEEIIGKNESITDSCSS